MRPRDTAVPFARTRPRHEAAAAMSRNARRVLRSLRAPLIVTKYEVQCRPACRSRRHLTTAHVSHQRLLLSRPSTTEPDHAIPPTRDTDDDMAQPEQITGLDYSCHQYGDHALQRVGIWQPTPRRHHGYWVIYLHGGAWRDPRNTHLNFVPSIKQIQSNFDAAVRGYISVDYRLSPHQDYPQDPAQTPKPELRIAKHPDHVLDIRAALHFLDTEYQISRGYILVGHSAGAMLAFQALMGQSALARQQPRGPIPLPVAIIGISGIYDLVGLNSRKEGYDGFISAAFGKDQKVWQAASPATFGGSFKETWSGSPLAILAHSPEDTLVDMPEIDSMAAKLSEDGINIVAVRDLSGEHDEVWKDGSQLASLVAQALQRLSSAG
ncbi:Arylformamidase [Purpureocillium takamizusanense]|uniref:Kynurenine formamidase n=1 Tax=Purpureocillium takamizusanense TaxID=2060973 RepID=A0A9Q8QGZ0_9HYPO|nr:Arylformamidase [Purpureocillium takamizusanense]UNI19062.1 Arylformamidase [Purpureocillium takamizusanense]